MNKKLLIVVALIVLAVAAFAMRGGNKPEENGAGTDKAGDTGSNATLIIGLDPDYESFDPCLAYEVYAQTVTNGIYNNLVHFEGNLDEIKPDLAETFEATPDAKTFTFHLFKDAKFASGNPVTAQDVVWSFNRLKNLQGNPAFIAEGIDSVEAKDDHTVVIHLKEPDGALLAKLTYSGFSVIDSKLAMENGATDAPDAKTADTAKLWFDSHSAGSGPYILESYTPKEEVVLKRNDNYWKTPAVFEKIVFKSIQDPGTQLMMLEKGDIDIAFNLGPENVKQLEENQDVTVLKAQSMVISFLAMNRDKSVAGPIANPDVQRAIRHAIDYKGLQEIAGEGCTTPTSIIQVGFLGALPPLDIEKTHDVEKAKEYMKKAGYADGFKTTLNVPSFTVEGTDLVTLAQKIQEDLKAIGIEVEINPSDVTQAFGVYREGKSPFGLYYWGADYQDPNNQLAFVAGGSVAGPRANWPASDAPELAELAQKAMGETDPEKRAEFLKEIQLKMDEGCPFIVLLQHGRQFAVRSNVYGADYIDPYKIDIRMINKK